MQSLEWHDLPESQIHGQGLKVYLEGVRDEIKVIESAVSKMWNELHPGSTEGGALKGSRLDELFDYVEEFETEFDELAEDLKDVMAEMKADDAIQARMEQKIQRLENKKVSRTRRRR